MWLAFFILAVFLNAVMDLLENEPHFNQSVFSDFNKRWWLKTESWKFVNFLPFTRYRLDGWHLAKSLMIVCLIASVVTYEVLFTKWVDFFFAGLTWNVFFNLFYHRFLRKP